MQYDKVSMKSTRPDVMTRIVRGNYFPSTIIISNRSIVSQLYVNNAAYVYNEETGEIEMLSQVDSVDDLQVRILSNTAVHCLMIYDLAPNTTSLSRS